uniref:Chlorophyll a-b binding protein, chloroplastic n=1 Tax=Oryza sativa subsp. japonica TaxID=39947 RepID=Q6H747_ORYSJ|nr:unknown protein [Oryza sativa Japonica Group]BAD25452.1 unknown protein [Oryza sativa Japonica Group]
MAAQALLSGRQLLGRPLQSSVSRSSSSRKAPFMVRAEATPPAKQGADRQLWFASKQSLSYLDGTGLRRGVQRPDGDDGRRRHGRPGAPRQAGPRPRRDGDPVVPDRRDPPRGHLHLLGRPLHSLRLRARPRRLRRAPPLPGLVHAGLHGEAVLPRPREVPRRLRRAGLPRRPALQPARLRDQERGGDEGAQAQGDQEWQARHARLPRLLRPGALHRGWPRAEPA